MIFLPLLLIYPLAAICAAEVVYVVAMVAVVYVVGYVQWIRWCMKRARQGR